MLLVLAHLPEGALTAAAHGMSCQVCRKKREEASHGVLHCDAVMGFEVL